MSTRATMRAAAALLACVAAAGCAHRAPAPESTPEPAQPAVIGSPPPPAPIETVMPLQLCVLHGGRLSTVAGQFNVVTGDTVVNGRPFREVYPTTAEFAEAAPWYASHEPITFQGHRYLQYGLSRQFGPDDVVPVGMFQGVAVFAEPGMTPPYDVVYLPVTPDCMFQPYQPGEVGGAVRG